MVWSSTHAGPHVRLVRICHIVAEWGCGGKGKTAGFRRSSLVAGRSGDVEASERRWVDG